MELLFSNKREKNTDTSYNMDKYWKHDKWKKQSHSTTNCMLLILWNHAEWQIYRNEVDLRLSGAGEMWGLGNAGKGGMGFLLGW